MDMNGNEDRKNLNNRQKVWLERREPSVSLKSRFLVCIKWKTFRARKSCMKRETSKFMIQRVGWVPDAQKVILEGDKSGLHFAFHDHCTSKINVVASPSSEFRVHVLCRLCHSVDNESYTSNYVCFILK